MATTQFSGPFDGSPVATQDQWRSFLAFVGEGVLRLGNVGQLACTVAADGTSVAVDSGYAIMQATTYQQTGGPVVIAIPANGTGSARADRVVLRYDPVAKTVSPQLLVGTSGAAPSLTRSATGVWEMPLARWTKQSGGSVTGFVDERVFVGPGTRACTDNARGPDPAAGQIQLETNTGRWVGYDGTRWFVLAEDSGEQALAPRGLWRSVGAGPLLRRVNGWTYLTGVVERTNGTLHKEDRTSPFLRAVPAAFRSSRDVNQLVTTSQGVIGDVRIAASDGLGELRFTTGDIGQGINVYLGMSWPVS